MTVVRLVLVAALVVGCGDAASVSTSAVSVPDAFLIVPGQRVGDFMIGRDNAAVIWQHKKDRVREQPDRSAILGLEHVLDGELQFDVATGGELHSVIVHSPAYATAQGLRVGSSASDMTAALGEPRIATRQQFGGHDQLVADYGGIIFFLHEGRVEGIVVRQS